MGIPPNISTEKLCLYRILQPVYGSFIKGMVETRGIEPPTIQTNPYLPLNPLQLHGLRQQMTE